MAKVVSRDLTVGSIRKNLFHMAWPLMLGMLFHTAFHLIDTVWVGMLGPNELAAISLFFPVVFIFIAVASGLSVGATALVAQAIGGKRWKEADNIAEHSLLLAVILGILIALFGFIFAPSLFVFMGADAVVLPLALSYSNIIFAGILFMFLSFMASSLIQAQGNSKTPMKFQAAMVVLNLILDPILMFGWFGFPAMGLPGAALATVFSRSLMSVLLVAYLFKDRTKIRLRPRDFSFDPKILKKIFSVGLPASIGQSINSIGMILLMALVGGFGSMAIAAFGIGMRLDSLILLPTIGMSQAVITTVGQNYGKKEIQRAVKTVKYGAVTVVLIALVLATVMLLFPAQFFQPFTSEQAIISIGAAYLSIVAFSYAFKSATLSISAGFQGTGKTVLSMLVMLSSWIFTIGIGWYLSQSMGLEGIWFGLLASSIISAAIAFIIFKSRKWL